MTHFSRDDQEDRMNRFSQFLNACLLSFALTILLVGSNMAVSRLLAHFV